MTCIHATYCNLTDAEKDERLHHLQQGKKASQSKINGLKQQISKATNEQGMELDEVLMMMMQRFILTI